MDFKITSICAPKDTIKRVKRQPTEWDKIFANHIFDKEFVCRLCSILVYDLRKLTFLCWTSVSSSVR